MSFTSRSTAFMITVTMVSCVPLPKLQLTSFMGDNPVADARHLTDAMISRMFMRAPNMFGMLPPAFWNYGQYPYQQPQIFQIPNSYPFRHGRPEYNLSQLPGMTSSNFLNNPSILSELQFPSSSLRNEFHLSNRKNPSSAKDNNSSVKSKNKRPSRKFWSKKRSRYGKKSFFQKIKAKHTTTSSINFKTRIPQELMGLFPFNRRLYLTPESRQNKTQATNVTADEQFTKTDSTSSVGTTVDYVLSTTVGPTEATTSHGAAEVKGAQDASFKNQIVVAKIDTSKNSKQNAGPAYSVI